MDTRLRTASPPRIGVALVVATVLLSLTGGALAQETTPPPTVDTTESSHDHDHGPMTERGTPTAAEQEAADRLVAATRSEVARYSDSTVAEQEGYRPITPFAFYGARAAHYQRDARSSMAACWTRSIPSTSSTSRPPMAA